ncbi:protein farnesyltransferase/geranylgeranyltransferase type-1 subunit alpha [Sporothrix brasiliensis 5110]|uniref:Protein farnesyltransferase/geranylgeranyltransferase type-1 subunit alpha n=1 Tax=Sporothrix brasiliensis 5110 TaxID=1398154 RepID=A0A0C2EPW7_9PEZI|nr:protein farnesyltransferase/geranylgeranyltransferase type-1 subunit alpha [Sporothrix brasiliensis 5110]KIH88349.1 protein farnesyltransferase/geranylgeranyltransferase type-1 subunit alpha [Sporothrix brasiliensis 5110]
MPPKGKAAPKAKETDAQTKPAAPQPPKTVDERSHDRYYQGRPYARVSDTAGISALSPADRTAWASAKLLGTTARNNGRSGLSNKAQKELWRHVNEASLPLRTLPRPSASSPSPWGRDKSGRPIGDYSFDEFRQRTEKRVRLTALEVAHHAYLAKRDDDAVQVTPDDVQVERQRRADIAVLRMELYGQRTGGAYAQDPDWDDVVPIALDEPEGALAAIAYPDTYAEAISYLRAVMTKPEYSTRCLRLTEHVISLNPAHYTVWLYRFSIVNALQLPVQAEMEWLNEVALENLKNYQIWHHRYLLAEYYYPQIAGSLDEVTAFARSEMAFLATILSEDTKNYHVWSYRQYLVRKLGFWVDDERKSMEAFIQQDVRNNSAWSHRFFLVFSDPNHSSNRSQTGTDKDRDDGKPASLEATLGELNISHDPEVPAAIVDREIAYAQEQILRAPQNESPWNYLRGVLTKGGRPLASMEEFAQQFVSGIGSDGSEETVNSTHAMDMLAAAYEEKGDKAQAGVYLQRLAEKWDPIRAGYWQYRKQQLAQ